MNDAIRELLARVKSAAEELASAERELKSALDDHYGLLGRTVVRSPSLRFRIDHVEYTARGTVFKVSGPRIKADGTLSSARSYAYPDWQTNTLDGLEPL